jgi:hypothetical protein
VGPRPRKGGWTTPPSFLDLATWKRSYLFRFAVDFFADFLLAEDFFADDFLVDFLAVDFLADFRLDFLLAEDFLAGIVHLLSG